MRASNDDRHISGAEGVFPENIIYEKAASYIEKALNHSRGKPETINISIDKLNVKPIEISTLPLCTLKIDNENEAFYSVFTLLESLGIKNDIINKALHIIKGNKQMRGATLLNIKTGERLDKDRIRGVRASRFGITFEASETLSLRLKSLGIDNIRVKDAIILASKVASCLSVVAELCVSDNPDYTTGYIASNRYGYLRIPFIKENGSMKGGRVFFIEDSADIDFLRSYLEEIPVIIDSISKCKGTVEINEIINTYNR